MQQTRLHMVKVKLCDWCLVPTNFISPVEGEALCGRCALKYLDERFGDPADLPLMPLAAGYRGFEVHPDHRKRKTLVRTHRNIDWLFED